MIKGKNLLPSDRELEQMALACMIIDPECVLIGVEKLTEDVFYFEEHKIIFRIIKDRFEKGRKIDLYLIYNELRKENLLDKIGGSAYLSEITSLIATSVEFEDYLEELIDLYKKRELNKTAHEVINQSQNGESAGKIIQKVERKLIDIASYDLKDNEILLKNGLRELIEKYEKITRGEIKAGGIPTRFRELDALTGGLHKSDLIIIAGRTSMGKTSLALSIALNVEVPQAIFSLEMSKEQILMRMFCMKTETDIQRFKTGKLNSEEWSQKVNFGISQLNKQIIIVDEPSLTPLEIRAKARKLKEKYGIGLFIIDYLQLIRVEGRRNDTREREVAIAAESLKALAKELDVPVVALAQLRRAVEDRGDKRPRLSDLRESGAIEQIADVVILIHRPEYYGAKHLDNGLPSEGIAEIIVAKQRNGPVGELKLKFVKEYAKFVELEGEIQKENDFPF